MAFSRKDRVSANRSQQQIEDDALELHEKEYSDAAIGDLQGVSGSTAKDRIKSAKIRHAEEKAQSKNQKVVPFQKEA
mgnify:CR=1 FL=1